MIKLQCIGCKKTRNITIDEASSINDQPCCETCGMPEIVVQAKSRRQNVDLRKVFR